MGIHLPPDRPRASGLLIRIAPRRRVAGQRNCPLIATLLATIPDMDIVIYFNGPEAAVTGFDSGQLQWLSSGSLTAGC